MNPRPPPRKIVVVTNEFYPKRGGIATYAQELARALDNAGQAVAVWVPNHPTLADCGLRCPVIGMTVKGNHGWLDRMRFARWMRSVSENEIRESVFVFAEPGPIWALLYGDLLRMPKLACFGFILHGSELAQIVRVPVLRDRFGEVAAHLAFVGVVSTYNRRVLLEAYPELKERCHLMPGGGSVVPCLERGEGEQGDSFKILTVGRIHPRKGQMAVLEAIAGLPAELRSKVRYRAVGPIVKQGYADALRQYSERRGINFEMTGSVPEEALYAYYREADMFALTSVPYRDSVEGLGLVYVDAARMGLPLLAHRIGGVEDVVKHGLNGILADPRDRTSLTTALQLMMENTALRERLAHTAPESVAEFTWERVAQTLVEAL